MKARAFFTAVCVLMSIAVCAHQSNAQAAPGAFADAIHPAGPPDPIKLDSIWQVDPLTGSLSVTIPFTTTPTGGRGPKIPFSLHYNSASTVTLQGTGSVSIPGILSAADGSEVTASMQVFTWGAGNLTPNPSGPLGPWTTSGPFMYSSASNVLEQNVVPPPGPPDILAGCWIYGPFIYTDESGAAHDMNLEQTNVSVSTLNLMPPCQNAASASQTYGSAYFTTDGSALATQCCNSTPNIVQPDGTQVSASGSGATLEDSNGNIASLAFNSTQNSFIATDSLGRTAFSTTLPIDYVGQIPVGTYNVTTYGATGNADPEQYSVVFSQTALGSFTMQHPVGGAVGAAGTEIQLLGFCGYSYECPTAFMVNQVTPGGQGSTLPVVSSITLPDSTQYAFTYDPTYGTISKIVFPTGGHVRFVWGIRGDGGGHGQFNLLSTIVVNEVCISPSGNGGGINGEPCNANEIAWQYNLPSYSPSSGLTSRVTAPDGSYTAYTGVGLLYDGVPLYQMGAAPSWKEASRLEYSGSNKLMKSVATTYWTSNGATGLPAAVATTLYDGPTFLQQYVQYAYDFTENAAGYMVSYGNVIEKDESDFNPCTGTPCPMPTTTTLSSFVRKTFTNYAYASNPAFVTAHIVNKPSQVLVTNGAGHPYSLVQYGYDQAVLSGSSGYVNHDDANYGISSPRPRGNLTTESHCAALNTSATFNAVSAASAGSACSLWLPTTHSYDLAGQMVRTTDPKGNKTLFSYTDNYTGGSGIPPGSPTPQTDGYVTMVTYLPYGYMDTYSYNYDPGQLATHTDWNGQTTGKFTQYLYNDPGNMNRITETQYPDGGDVQISYIDTPPFSVATTTKTGGTNGPIVRTTLYDGLGRKYQTQLNSDPSGTDYVNTTYDSMGRVQSVTNPFRTTSDPTYGITSYRYDALGRKTFQTNPDSSFQQWCYDGYVSMGQTNCRAHTVSTVATWVDSADENGNDWQRTSDGLGRLTSVSEPNGASQAPSMVTNYSYDPLNNLLSVAQWGGSTATGITRNRTFTYDSLSRLLCASNPENSTAACPATSTGAYVAGTTGYTYDADSNVQTKTDARGVTTTYVYNELNQVLSKTYSDGATPLSCYQYNTSSATPACPTNPNWTGPNWLGRLTNAWTQSASTTSSCSTTASFLTKRTITCYDPMGRIWNEQQYTPASQASGAPYAPAYTYDLAGNLISSTSGVGPSPITLTNTFDGAGRLQKLISSLISNPVTGAALPATLFSLPTTGQSTVCANSTSPSPPYAAFGGLMNAALGNGLTLNRAYDSRLRTTCETDIGSIVASPTSGSATVTITGEEQSK